jgi:hypothetical protein
VCSDRARLEANWCLTRRSSELADRRGSFLAVAGGGGPLNSDVGSLISRIVTLDDLTADFRSIDRTPLLRDWIRLIATGSICQVAWRNQNRAEAPCKGRTWVWLSSCSE